MLLVNSSNKTSADVEQEIAERAEQYHHWIISKLSVNQLEGNCHPAYILNKLLNEKYFRGYQNEYNRSFVENIKKFHSNIASFPNKFENTNYLFSVISALNERAAYIKDDDELIPILNAFFSIYSRYRLYLNDTICAKIQAIDSWGLDLNTAIDRVKNYLFNVNMIGNESCEDRVNEIANQNYFEKFPSYFVTSLLNNMDVNAAYILSIRPNCIPEEMYTAIKEKIFSMMQSSSHQDDKKKQVPKKNLVYELLDELHSFVLLPQDRPAVIQFLIESLKDESTKKDALYSMICFFSELSNEMQNQVIDHYLDAIRLNYYANGELSFGILGIYEIADSQQKKYITSSLRAIAQDDASGKLQLAYIVLWNDDEQTELVSRLLDMTLSGDHHEVDNALRAIMAISNYPLYRYEQEKIMQILHDIISNKMSTKKHIAVRLIFALHSYISREDQEQIVKMLLAMPEQKDFIFSQYLILSKLNHLLTSDQLKLIITSFITKLKENPDMDVMMGINEIYACLTKGQCNDVLSALMDNLVTWELSHNEDHQQIYLCLDLINKIMPLADRDCRKNVLLQSFNIVSSGFRFKTVIKFLFELIERYVLNLDYHDQIAMMGVIRYEYPIDYTSGCGTDFLKCYHALYQASTARPAHALLQRLSNIHLPEEMIENIVQRFAN